MPTLDTPTDYYALLGLDPGANSVTIRKAVVAEQRRWGARQNAPDLATRQEAERQAQLLNDIRAVLLDPGRKALYDIQRVEALPTLPDWQLPSAAATSTVRSDWSRRIAGAGVALALLLFLATRASTGTLVTPATFPTAVSIATEVAPDSATESPSTTPVPPATVVAQVFVANTDGQGVFLRSAPAGGDRLSAWPDGSQLDVVGEDVTGGGLMWASVRTSDGQVGFVPRQYISTKQPPTQPPAVPTRAPAPVPLPDEVPVTLAGISLATGGLSMLSQPFALAGGHYSLAWLVAGRQPCDFVITIADSVTPGLVRTTLSNHILNRIDGQPAPGQTSVNLNSGKYRLDAYSDTCAWSLTLRAGAAS